MSIVEVKKKWGVAPAFNLEFVAYYEDRERRIEALKKQVAQDKKDFEDLRNQESEVTLKFNQIQKILNELSGVNDDLRQKVEDFRALLGMGGLEIPKTVSKVSLSKLSSTEPTSVAIKARSTAYSSALSLQVTICDEQNFFCIHLHDYCRDHHPNMSKTVVFAANHTINICSRIATPANITTIWAV